jgi:hypothetical protein
MKSTLRLEARRLRQQGMSIKEIRTTLKVAKSSASLWVRDVELIEAQKEVLQERRRTSAGQSKGAQVNREKGIARRTAYQEAGRAKAREMRPLHLAGCMLYWAEGGKSRRDAVIFVNSDPNMVRFFIRFLREELEVNDSLISLQIHCHTNVPDEVTSIENYWLDVLALPPSALMKTMYKKGNNEITHRKLLHGVCGIWITRSAVIQHILGAIQEYGGFDEPSWVL